MDPIFWLGLSILLVAIGIAAVLLAMIPTLKELGRAAQGAEKLFETLNRELPPTLEAIRLTSLELTELSDEMVDGIQSAGQVAQQVENSVTTAKAQTQRVAVTTKSLAAGFKAAWKTLTTDEMPPIAPEEVVQDERVADASQVEIASTPEVAPSQGDRPEVKSESSCSNSETLSLTGELVPPIEKNSVDNSVDVVQPYLSSESASRSE